MLKLNRSSYKPKFNFLLFTIAITFILSVVAVGIAGAQYDDDNEDVIIDDTQESTITFDDQTTNGSSVVVASTFLPNGGYVVIHEVQNGSAGPVLGSTAYMEPGNYTRITVALDESISQDQELIAMTHQDDGDQVYEFPESDAPYISDGSPVIDNAMVTVEMEEEPTETPGFGAVIAIGMVSAGYYLRRKK